MVKHAPEQAYREHILMRTNSIGTPQEEEGQRGQTRTRARLRLGFRGSVLEFRVQRIM